MARVLILGAYGLIGAEIARKLNARGHEVVALGRDLAVARRVLPGYRWVIRDLRALTRPEDWQPIVTEVDFVVNCAGALQQNLRDDLAGVHLHAIGALVLACEKSRTGIVQISAVGAEPHAKLAFHRTKAEGDALIRESHADWWIFRPGLVIAPSSYGGTTLIRMLAGLPIFQPIALPNARVQAISVGDVVLAVQRAIEGETPPGLEADLVEEEVHALVDIVGATRRWLGFPPARFTLALPLWALRGVARMADLFGLLGWRSPMRSTAIRAVALGVTGRPAQTRLALGRAARSLEQTFYDLPAHAEDRQFARMQMLGPLLIFAMAIDWVAQGLSGFLAMNDLVAEFVARGHPEFLSRLVVASLSSFGIVLGLALMVRRWALRVLVVMAFVLIFYGVAISVLVPSAWLDPFGGTVDLFPMAVALLIARVVMDNR
jgi:uncharacterized protein YbjT (DUF2867 family)